MNSVHSTAELRQTVEALLSSLQTHVEIAARTEGERSPMIVELREIIRDIRATLGIQTPVRSEGPGQV